jgi:hypothetical protein
MPGQVKTPKIARRRTGSRKAGVRAPYRMVSPPTWELARAAYLGGETAQAVADRFGIGLQNLRQKIFREGWSKRALAEARTLAGPGGPPVTPTPHASPADAPGAALPAAATPAPPADEDLMATVLRRAREALTSGRGSEATALLKAARDYVTISEDVERARETFAALLPGDAALPSGAAAALSDGFIRAHLEHLWRPGSPGDALMRIRELLNATPPGIRETALPGLEAYIAALDRR